MIKLFNKYKYKISIILVLIISIVSLLPNSINKEIEVETIKESNNVVYLLDNDYYLLKVNVYIDNDNIENVIREKIEILKYGMDTNNLINTINSNTKINSIKIDKNNVYIDFDEYFYDSNNIERAIESIIFSLTEINGIDNIYLSVNNSCIKECLFTRNYGINKEYDLNSLYGIDKTIIYFIREKDNEKYYVPITKISNNETNKVNIIISELKSSAYSVNNLESYVSNNLELYDYIIEDNKVNLIFNDYILFSSNSNEILEEVKYVIASSIFENIDYDEVIFSTENNKNIDSVQKTLEK